MKKTLAIAAILIAAYPSYAQTTWLTTGNTGAVPPTNFLGTNDANALQFRVNKQPSGYIDYAPAKANTSFGYQSLKNLSGNSNTSFGYKAAYSNSTGANNVSLGAYALYFNTTGYSNVAAGIGALYKNTTQSNLVAIGDSALYNNIGTLNTAIGSKALYSNTTGIYNTAIGFQTLTSNTTGGANTATGYFALYSMLTGADCSAYGTLSLYHNTYGLYNTASGASSLYSNTNGSYNTACGGAALYANTSGYYNTACGHLALYRNIAGSNNTAAGASALNNNTTGTDNDAKGYQSLYTNTTGSYNAAEGATAMYYNTTGSYNTAAGVNALYNNTTSYYNTAVGFLALGNSTPGYNNVAVGSFAGPPTDYDGLYNTVAVGEACYTTASNQARIGNSSTTSIGGYVGWSNVSDGRVKKNIKQNVPGLTFINKLQPVTYNLDLDAVDKLIPPAAMKDEKGNKLQPAQQETEARKAKEQIVYTGFVAQDVEKAARSLSYDFSGVDAPKNSKDMYGLRYAEFVVPLVKAVQELSKKNDEKDSVINSLESRLAKIEAAMSAGNQQSMTNNSSLQLNPATGASLSQNIPNPFGNITTISYTLPQVYSSARIVVTDKTGQVIKQMNVSGTSGSIHIDAATLTSGAYQYSLYVDGRLVDSKQMMALK